MILIGRPTAGDAHWFTLAIFNGDRPGEKPVKRPLCVRCGIMLFDTYAGFLPPCDGNLMTDSNS